MKPVKYTMAALALIAMASFTTSANAQVTPTPAAGDLILGIYDGASSNAVPTSYEVDLGAFSTLPTTGTETWNLGTTITSTFSGDSSASLQFNIAASASSLGAAGGLASKEIAFTAVSLPTLSASNSGANTDIAGTEVPTLGSANATALTLPGTTSSNGTTFGAGTVSNSTSGSFEDEIVTNNNYGLGGTGTLLNPYPSTNAVTFYTKTGSGAGDTTANADGTFSFSISDGQEILTYDATATPEPSAYALGLCAVALFWVLKRRRSVA